MPSTVTASRWIALSSRRAIGNKVGSNFTANGPARRRAMSPSSRSLETGDHRTKRDQKILDHVHQQQAPPRLPPSRVYGACNPLACQKCLIRHNSERQPAYTEPDEAVDIAEMCYLRIPLLLMLAVILPASTYAVPNPPLIVASVPPGQVPEGWVFPENIRGGNEHHVCPGWDTILYGILDPADGTDVTIQDGFGTLAHMGAEMIGGNPNRGHSTCISANSPNDVPGDFQIYSQNWWINSQNLNGNVYIHNGPTVWLDLGETQNVIAMPNSGHVVINGVFYLDGVRVQ